MKKVVLAGIVVALAMPAGASGHQSGGWNWSAGLAEQKYVDRYGEQRVVCYGFGRPGMRRNGTLLYTHFDCNVGSAVKPEWVMLHVLGKYRFKLT